MPRPTAALLTGALLLLATPLLATAAPPPGTTCQDGPQAIHATSPETNGTPGDDTIFGSPQTASIDGLAGDDCIQGSDGGGKLYGGAGDDLLIGGRGDDALYDGGTTHVPDTDTLVGGDGNDSLFSDHGGDTIDAGPGDDTIGADNRTPDTIDCGPGTDKVEAGFADTLTNCESDPPANAVRSASPRTGTRRTRFLVRFRGTRVANDEGTNYTIAVAAPAAGACATDRPRQAWNSNGLRGGRDVVIRSMRLRPPGATHRWCRGAYVAELHEVTSGVSSSCEDADAECDADEVIGRFRFRVR
jgi:RTX calcium-binding nonapeptide repeat (4 copies)